jgi:hypothetical protein
MAHEWQISFLVAHIWWKRFQSPMNVIIFNCLKKKIQINGAKHFWASMDGWIDDCPWTMKIVFTHPWIMDIFLVNAKYVYTTDGANHFQSPMNDTKNFCLYMNCGDHVNHALRNSTTWVVFGCPWIAHNIWFTHSHKTTLSLTHGKCKWFLIIHGCI